MFDGCSNFNQGISVYPNPTIGRVKIVGLASGSADVNIRILDILGKEQQSKLIKIEDYIELPEEKGVYFILVQDSKTKFSSTIRIIKE